MKKTLVTLALTGFAAAAFAQGTVNWTSVAGNFVGTTNSATVSSYSPPGAGSTTGPQGSGTTAASTTTLFYYELLVSSSQTTAPTTVSTLATWSDTGLEAQNSGAANGRILQLNSSSQAVAQNWAAGVTENVIMVGWSANIGTTYAAALGFMQNANYNANLAALSAPAFFGVGTSVGSIAAASGNPGVTVFGTSTGLVNDGSSNPLVMNQLVSSTPEPATMALAGLGGLSLLALRRKK